MPETPPSSHSHRPMVDEWGVYDPQQAGLAALYTRLTDPPGPVTADPRRDGATARELHEPPPLFRSTVR